MITWWWARELERRREEGKKKGKEREENTKKPRTTTTKKISRKKKSLHAPKSLKKTTAKEARDAFWTKQFAFFPRVDKCSLINQGMNGEEECWNAPREVPIHLSRRHDSYILLLIVGRYKCYSARLSDWKERGKFAFGEESARNARALRDIFFANWERKTTKKQPKGRKETSFFPQLFLGKKCISRSPTRAQKTRPARHLATRESRFLRAQTMDAIFVRTKRIASSHGLNRWSNRARARVDFFCWKRTKEEERSLMSHIPVKIQISTFSFSSSSSSSRPSAWTALSRTRVNVLYKKMRRAFTTRSRVFVIIIIIINKTQRARC